MSKVGEKVAYLKGLAEGLGVNDETEQGKLMLAMIDTLEALAKNSEETDERVGELSEYVEEIDSDVSDLVKLSSARKKSRVSHTFTNTSCTTSSTSVMEDKYRREKL